MVQEVVAVVAVHRGVVDEAAPVAVHGVVDVVDLGLVVVHPGARRAAVVDLVGAEVAGEDSGDHSLRMYVYYYFLNLALSVPCTA